MKKIFTLFSFLTIGSLNAQSPSIEAWTLDKNGADSLQLTNGMTVAYLTSASNSTYTAEKVVKVRIKNISSANTYTYSVERKDVVLNPSGPAGAKAFFCFGDLGTCYPAFVTEADEFNVLGPGGSTVPGKHMVTYLDEAYTVGYSEVRYKLFNVATGKTGAGADTLSWTFKYNQLMSVNEHHNMFESVSNVYPNPSTNNANITVILTDEALVKVQVYNSLGALVYTGAEQHLIGKNKLAVDCTNFNNGLYFITVTAGNAKVTKRLVINK